jgi:mono/diheme cytochrome c family protein
MRGEAFVAKRARAFAIPTAARNTPNPIASDDKTLADSMHHYADHCAICHANNGSGETAIGKGLYPRPPDLRAADTQQLSDGELYWIIHNGVRFTGMPAFGDDKAGAPDEDSWKLVHFIRRLPEITDEELETMKRFNPVSRSDLEEEEQIRKFLAGEDVVLPAGHHH